MLKTWQFWLLNLAAFLALILVAINIAAALSNQDQREEINQRQQFLNQSVQLAQLNDQIIKSLASLAARTNDQSIKDLLNAHGISYSLDAAAAGEKP